MGNRKKGNRIAGRPRLRREMRKRKRDVKMVQRDSGNLMEYDKWKLLSPKK